MHKTLILKADWVIPMDRPGRLLNPGAVAVRDNLIARVGSTEELQKDYPEAHLLELPGHALLPGLINSHSHAAMNLLKGFADDLPLNDWLQQHIWPAEARWVSPNFVRDGSLLAMAEMIRGGVTCFNDMYFFPDITAHAAIETGMRACIGLIVIDFPSAWADRADEYLDKAIDLYQQYRDHSLIQTAFAPHAPYTVSDQPLSRIATLANELNCPVHMHIHETAHEVTESVRLHGVRPLQRLQQLQLLGPNLMAVHMTQLDDAEIELCAQENIKIVHCPESNLKLASGFCPTARLSAAGACVALGTDSSASNNDLDMFGEMRTAALLAKGVSGDAAALPAVEALRMATLHGAQALGIDAWTGSLEPGKQADLISVDLASTSSQPIYNPIAQIVYSSQRSQVRNVWVGGRQLLRDGHLTTLDEQALLATAHHWQEKISSQ